MCDNDSVDGASGPLTPECLRYFDELRLSPDVVAKTKPFSSVVRVETDDDDNKSYRLCHLTSMLPSTTGNQNLQPDFGLYTEGAGLLAMIHFNNRNDTVSPDLARLKDCDVRFTMEFQDTQFSPIVASRALTNSVLTRTHSLQTPVPISMVGATRSAVTGPLAILGGVHKVPIVSYGSTSSDLEFADSYPYFGRTVPTNQGDAKAAVSYLRNFLGATHCSVIFVRDGYGNAYHSEFRTAANELRPPMIVESVHYDPDSKESVVSAVETIRKADHRFIFGIISTPTYDMVMREAYRAGIAGVPGFTWFLPDGALQLLSTEYDVDLESDLAAASGGVGIISLDIADSDEFMNAWATLETSSALKDYFVSKHDPQLDFSNFEFYDSPTYWEYLQYDAVLAIGFAACEAQDEYFTGPSLFDAFVKTSFQGASGLVSFEETGTRDFSRLQYKVTNVVAQKSNERNKITFSSSTTSVLNGTKWVTMDLFVYSDGTTTTPSALPPVAENLNLIPSGVLIFGYVLTGVLVVLSLSFGLWTLVNRKTMVVRLSQPFFLDMICVGTLLMGASVVFMTFQEPMSDSALDAACVTVPWLLSVGFVVAFSALFSKTLRIYKVAANSGGFRRVVVKVQDVLVPFLVLLTLNVAILTSWTIVAPLQWIRRDTGSLDQYGRSVDSYGRCQSEESQLEVLFYVLLAFVDVAAIVLANIANYRARKISSDLHEFYFIGISMATMLEASLIGIPALLVVHDAPTSFFLVRAFLVAVFCCAILLPLFVPKVIQAHRDGYRTGLSRGRMQVPATRSRVSVGSSLFYGTS